MCLRVCLCEEVEEVFDLAFVQSSPCVTNCYAEVDDFYIAPFGLGGLVRACAVLADVLDAEGIYHGGFVKGSAHCYLDVSGWLCPGELYCVCYKISVK